MSWLRRMGLALVLALVVPTITGCGDDDSGSPTAQEKPPPQPEGGLPLLGSDCDSLVPEYCAIPFPSNVYLQDDPTGLNTSGKSVRFGETTLPPRKKDQAHADPALFYDHDGFSPSQAPMTFLPGASDVGLATPYDIERSLDDDSPTVLIEADTGRHVPHWVDIDQNTQNDGTDDKPDQRLVMLRPAERLKDGTRYIVAIRGVQNQDGQLIEPSKVFRALRDDEKLEADASEADVWTVYARRKLYADIFDKLKSANVEKDDLQIAWDYTTATTENVTGRMIEMRDKALAVVGDDGPSFKLSNVEELTPEQSPDLLRRIEVTMTVPLYLTAASFDYDPNGPLDRLNLNEQGELVQNGTMDMTVLILVPRSVETAGKHGLLQNGHGLFGSRNEGRGGYLARAANRNHYIAFAVNYFGFDEDSFPLAGDALAGRFEAFKAFPERQIQGMVNQLLAMRMMMGRVAKDGIKDDQNNVLLDSAWIDPSVRAYRGDSQGGIMGATYMAVSTDVTRGLLGEPGMPYNLLLNRSVDYATYALVLNSAFDFNAVYNQLVLGLAQMEWDRSEPGGFATHVQQDLLPNTPAHRVIMHVARGDHQVSNFGAHLMASAIGAKQMKSDDPQQPVFDPIYGVDEVSGPVSDGSVIIEYDFGLAKNPAGNVANKDGCDPHDRVRDLIPSYDQQDEFYRTGNIVWKCKGACNCDDSGNDPNQEERCTETFESQCK